jgi:hypothetical protein
MALTITHSFVSAKADGPDNTLVKPSDWNANHTLTGFPNDPSVFLDGTGNFSFPTGVWSANEAGVFVTNVNGVGINNSNPQAPLHITHDTGAGTQGVALRIDSVSGSGGCGAGILWTDNADVLQMAMVSGQDDDNWGGRLVFFTSPQTSQSPGGSLRERMRITSTGDVAIGNDLNNPFTSPQAKLHVHTDTDGTDPVASVAIIGDVYSRAQVFNVIGVKGSVTNGSVLSNMFSLYAGAPTLDHGGTTQNAYGLFIEDVNVATELNCAIRTGAGAVWVTDRLWVGDQPICSNAKMTVYQNMSVDTNTSMIDVVGFAVGSENGDVTNVTALNVLPTSQANVAGRLVGVYAKSRIWGGNVNESAAIYVDTPESGESSVSKQYGIYIKNQDTFAGDPWSLYCEGAGTVSAFEGSVLIGTNEFDSSNPQLYVTQHGQNAIAVLGEGYANNTGGTSIGVKGIASVGVSNQASQLVSIVAGSPETDGGATVLDAIGLKVENVDLGQTSNWSIKTGVGAVNLNDNIKVFTTALGASAFNTSNLSVVGTAGSSQYNFVASLADDNNMLEGTASGEMSIIGPDTLDPQNYIAVSGPGFDGLGRPLTWRIYRTFPLDNTRGFIGSISGNDTLQITDINQVNTDRQPTFVDHSTGIQFYNVDGSRQIYNSNGSLKLGANSGGRDVEFRLSTITSWSDAVPTAFAQFRNVSEHPLNLTFCGGTDGWTPPFERLEFLSTSTTFNTTPGAWQSQPPVSAVEIFNQNNDLQGLMVTCLDTTNNKDIFVAQILSPEHAAYAPVFRIDPTGRVQMRSFTSGITTIAADSAPVFDCAISNVLEYTTNGDMSPTFVNFLAGQEITVIIHQDISGPRTVTWPGNVIGGKPLPNDNSVLVQKFVAASDGNLYAFNDN